MASLLRFLAVWIVVPLVAFQRSQGKSINSFAGPYIVYVNTFEMCPSDGTHTSHLRLSHFNPARPFSRQTLTGNVTLRKDFTDNYMIFVDLATRSNNQWKENAFIMNFPKVGCSTWREQVPEFFHFFANISGASEDKNKPCRIPAGEYIFKNEPMKWRTPNFKVMPYGRYRMRIKIRDGPTVVGCNELDCEAIPRPS
ncbi:uncharacterized protein LOC117639643 [Thrips palmi]|uniref:Uncharacterized protein LOC117639643 n=1 Tax=Thrips palmi TaxID=161013 RepID=A0A6P8XWJ4_THRPL|nr:uncharacterized protein LOC117639643 [Thrips palmi]